MTREEFEKTRSEWIANAGECFGAVDCMCPKCDPDFLLDRIADLAAVARRPPHEHPLWCKCSNPICSSGHEVDMMPKIRHRMKMKALIQAIESGKNSAQRKQSEEQ